MNPVFLYNPSHEMLFKWVTHHYSVKHGGADIVKKNVRNKHALEIDFFYDYPILFPYLTEQFLEKICSSSERKHFRNWPFKVESLDDQCSLDIITKKCPCISQKH